jgi:hypothetical protein
VSNGLRRWSICSGILAWRGRRCSIESNVRRHPEVLAVSASLEG